MGKLKLFISHSSRLDDVPHKYTSADHNWKLLEDTCSAIKAKYGDRIDVLVDRDGLVPGEDWNHQLNLWLSECHVALILFSKRAVDTSAWVQKEATILSWRAELNDDFTLIPVTIKNETSVDDLAKDYLGTLKIDTNQCIRDIQSADDIVAGFALKFGEPDKLRVSYPQTPLEKLQGGISKLLSDQTTQQSITDALQTLGCKIPADGSQRKERFSDLLAREFLSFHSDDESKCFNVFKTGLDKLTPPPEYSSAEYLFGLIRPLWVEAGAAGKFPQAMKQKVTLLMSGALINQADEVLGVRCYTLRRCIERAWPGSSDFCIVTSTPDNPIKTLKKNIQDVVLGPDYPSNIPEEFPLQEINENGTRIILVISHSVDNGGLPDPRKLKEIQQLNNDYQNIVIIISNKEDLEISSELLSRVSPTPDPKLEFRAFTAERASRQFLNRKYP